MIPFLLWVLATLDAAFIGYRNAAGRNALINKRAYYRHAMIRAALFGQAAVAIVGIVIAALLLLSSEPAEQVRQLQEAGSRMLIVYIPYALILLIAFALRAIHSVDLRSLTSVLIFGPFTLIRPVIVLCGVIWGFLAAPGFVTLLLGLLILTFMLGLGRVLDWHVVVKKRDELLAGTKESASIRSFNTLLVLILTLVTLDHTCLAQSNRDSRPSTPVSITVTVVNNHREPISALPQNAFTISDDTGVRDITSFSNEDAPASVGILLDLSASVKSERIEKKSESILNGLARFIEKSNPSNEYFIFGFDTTTYLFLDGTRDANAAISALRVVASEHLKGSTALFDACIASIERVERGTLPKKVIILVSDGRDNRSQYRLEHVRRLLKGKNVLLYAVNIAMRLAENRIDWQNSEGMQVLEEFTSLTGGGVYSPNSAAGLQADLERIALELRHQYSISFLPAKDAANGKWHPLKIKITSSTSGSRGAQRLSLRSRTGYYSTSLTQ